MQNFRNNSVPPALPPGFSGGSAVGGGNGSYLPQSSAPQCSPRMAEEYVVVQQQTQQNPQRPNQHPHQLVTHHPSHSSHILGYGGRNRGSGTGEALHSHANSGGSSVGNNPYRKEMMDHYFSISGKDRHRRGGQGLGYGLGFGYPNLDGHLPHQYRHAGAGSSGMMAHYQLDYSAAAGSSGNSNSGSSSGTGAFSPSHQYSLSQNTSIQTAVGPPVHSRPQAQNYSSQQALHQGQQHRGYPTSGHRLPLQFSLYSSPNAPTGTPGMYNSPPLRYHGGSNSGGFECKVNSSSTTNATPSSVSSANSNNTGALDGAGQSYHSSGYSAYHSQPSHSLHKHPSHPQHGSQHNLSLGYDASHKIHSSSLSHKPPPPGLSDPENRATSIAVPSTNSSMPQFSSQEISKSPMHSQSHPPQMHQNFSPISNPSPAASTVQSPSCSSSPSPLMGISEPGNSTGPQTHPPSHPPLQKTRNSHSHGRLLQTVPQLSPTPNSDSSISSCGSNSGNVNSAGSGTNSLSCMAVGIGAVREENPSSTLYPSSPLDKLMPESAVNSLNALTSQVANLPNTVQHMLLSDSLMSHKTGKDGVYQEHMREHVIQPSSHVLPPSQQRGRAIGDTFSTKAAREGIGAFSGKIANSEGGVVESLAAVPESPLSGREAEDQFSGGEGERIRQMSGASSGSEPTGYYPLSHNHRNQIQSQTEQGGQRLPLQMEMEAATRKNQDLTSQSVSQLRNTEHEAHGSFPKSPSSSSPSSRPTSAQPSPNLPASCPPVSLVPPFSSPSPSLSSSFHTGHMMKVGVDSQHSDGEREKEEREGKRKKEEENKGRREEWKPSKETKVNSEEERDRDKQGGKGQIEVHSHPSKRKQEEQEKQEKVQYLEDPRKNMNTEETYNTGVGVIVSARSENLQSGTIPEPQTTTSVTPHSVHQSHHLRNYEPLSHSSAGDSNNLNGDDGDKLCTYSSYHGIKVPHKLSTGHSMSPPPQSSEAQEIPCGPSEPHHGTGVDLKIRGRGGVGANVKYQGYHQPQPCHNSGAKKGEGVDELGRRGNGFDAGRGQEHNSQLQQQLQQPSLLQEVLQGYHLDRRYGRTENSTQKISNAYTQSQNTAHQSHSRHPYGMPESARLHVLVPESGIQGDHQSHTRTAAPGKHHIPNQGKGSESIVRRGASSHSLSSGGLGAKEEHCIADKHQIGTSHSHSMLSMEQSTESSSQLPPKHINLADYSQTHRRPSSNLSAHNSAVQQILLQNTEPLAGIGVPKSQTRPHVSSSFSSSSVSSSERRSVICDISPSCRTTPERERDGETDHGKNHPQTGSSVASVIQQSHPTHSVMQEPENGKVDEAENKAGDFKPISKTAKEAQNLTSNSGNFPAKEASVQHQNRSPHPSVDTNSETQRFSSGRKGESNSNSSLACHPQQATQHPSSTPGQLCSLPSRCQRYFQSLDEAGGHSTGLGRYGLGERVGTPKTIYQPQYPTHSHHNVPPQAQLENPKSSLKLQMYSHSQSHVLDDRCEWTAVANNRSTENIMMSPRSGRPQHQSPPGQRSHNSLPVTPHHLQGNYYDPVKIWGLSERDGIGTIEGGNSRRNQISALPSGAVALPATPASGTRCVQSNPPREELVKPLHQVPTSSSRNQSVCSNTSSTAGTANVNLGVQQGHGQNRTAGSGDTNPLMMRRRVRSFISPIPAKRQHQDLSQHNQRGSSSQYPSPLPNSESKHQSDAASSPDPSHTKMAVPNASSPSHGKTKILPPRKGRGLKLEAIVQKITPNVKKTSNNSHTNSASDQLSGLPHAHVTDCNPETQEQDTCNESNFSKIGTVTGSCLPYLSEGLSLDEIMYYRGVEETGPLPPTAYPCDPHQDPQILKRDATGNLARGAIGDLDPDFGINTSISPMTERDGVVERGKDELQIDSDFPLLGPLPPPPPLPRPVQASPPPSSSALSDIQHFTNTYQQLETRRGEHSAANLLRQKLQESGMGLGIDDYTGSDYFGTQPPHHNQNIGTCLLTGASHAYQQHLIPSDRAASSMAGLSQLPEPKPPENVVPKGYFPSGKKKGRPVGSVNKQKRAQPQAHAVSLNTPTVDVTQTLAHTPTHVPAQSASTQIVSSASSTAATSETSLPPDNKISSASVSPAASQTVKTDVDSEDVQPEIEQKSVRHIRRKGEGEEGEMVWVGSRQRRRRRRGVVAMVGTEELQTATRVGGKFGVGGSFPDYRMSAFAPYIHVERKEEELGAFCTIVNAEDELMKGENGGEGVTDVILTSTSSFQGVKGDREMDNMRDSEPVGSALLESCTTDKALPSSGYVMSGAVITESDHFGQLLCCLCKKWANYKNLGDLYGPYYPPEYTSKLPKSHSQTRQSLLTSRAGNTGVSVGTVSTESMKQNIQPTEAETPKSVMETQHIGYEDVDLVSPVAKDTTCPVGSRDMHMLAVNISSVDADSEEPQQQDLSQDMSKQTKQESETEKIESQLQNQQWPAEEMPQRPQHRKLTSHPRFKRRHKSSEDLPRSAPINNKALLPFQPPPQPLTQDSSEPLAQLAQLPQLPLDPEELWVHEGCIVWASGVYLVNGRLYGLKEALDGARDTCCSRCEAVGSTLGCYTKGCTLRYHYLCALEADCSLNEDNFSLRCLKHKFPLNSSTVKPVCPEQSERG